jgi:large subunit ribosomal protein L25
MAKVNPKLKAEKRGIFGRKVKRLRKQGLLPATIYGKGFEPVSVQLIDKEMEKVFAEVGEAGLVDLELDNQVMPILFRNPQYHPLIGNLIHIDCYKVNLKEKITAAVPIVVTGESLAVKGGNILVEVSNEIEVEALPTDLPEKIEVDISVLDEVGKTITVADVKLGEKIEIKTHPEQVIVKVEEPREEVIETPETTVTPGEVPATEQKAPEEDQKAASTETTETTTKKVENKKE